MKNSAFNPKVQENDLASKIVVGLERIAEAFRVLLWQHAKEIGLSPIQIQILIFVAHHREEWCKVTYLAQEFSLTKATISDAVKVLDKKGLISKTYVPHDSRSYCIRLSEAGAQLVSTTERFARPLAEALNKQAPSELVTLYQTLLKLIHELNQVGVVSIQRTCYRCHFFEKNASGAYCQFLQKALKTEEIRLDCKEFQAKAQD